MSEGKVIIEDKAPEVKEDISWDTDGLDEKEVGAAKAHGIIKEKSEEKKEEKKEVGDEKEETLDPANFEEMEESFTKDQGSFHKKFTPNSKALYFKFKRNKQLRQDAETRAEKAEKDRDFVAIQEKALKKQLKEVNDLLDKIDGGDDKLTTADIRKIAALKEQREEIKEKIEDKKEEAKKDPAEEKKHVDYLQEKSKNAEILGKSKYEDFDRYVELANEVVAKDKDIAVLLTQAFHDPEVDEDQLVEKIVKYAKLHSDFGKKPEAKEEKKTEKKDSKEIERIVANSQKKKTSASLTGGSGRREVSYDDLTVEDVAKMNRADYDKLPKEVRERVLRESV